MELSPSSGATGFSVSQEIPHISWQSKVHDHVHSQEPTMCPRSSHINLAHVWIIQYYVINTHAGPRNVLHVDNIYEFSTRYIDHITAVLLMQA